MTIKINTNTISELDSYKLFEFVVEKSFRQQYEFELVQVQKTFREIYGSLITTSTKQIQIIKRSRVPVLGELTLLPPRPRQ